MSDFGEPARGNARPYRVGYAPGAYDLFHIGHLNILRHARSRCDYLVAGVVSDEMAELAKGRRPMIPLVERLEIVRSVKYVDAAFVETVPDKVETWKQVRFDVIFKGDDWRGTPKGDKLEQDFAVHGVDVVYFPYTVHTSSTQLRRALDALAETPAVPGQFTAELR
ncbi:adenylyltransferase/cytidyltransferase family protein [Streptomyces sp. NPDC091371]|uniref:adenylyltransferase/cytidyltransferase family protein n=1 Tax=Streptomyces sp. NPDC091371 TaxID=3155303 RepID=UPI0034288104